MKTTKTTARPLSLIAAEVWRYWRKKNRSSNVHYGALPYLRAMDTLGSIDSSYGQDSARSIVLYFLSNARSWRGDDARRIKAELKALAS
jgi:hypothetical protein